MIMFIIILSLLILMGTAFILWAAPKDVLEEEEVDKLTRVDEDYIKD